MPSKKKGPAPIPLSVPEIGGRAWKYVKECLDTGWVSSVGAFVERFERMVEKRLGGAHAVAAVNGTAALHTALLAAGVRPGDEVLVPALTFVATANAVTYCGARPVFMDADAAAWGMDPAKVKEFFERECERREGAAVHRATGRVVRAILPVHVLGHPADMDPLVEAARSHGAAVVEDACEAIGASYKGRAAGRLGDVGVLSFNGNKVITTGGGGMVVAGDEALARRVRHLTTQAKSRPDEYVHDEVGYNYRLTNLQAALGCAQMEQLAGFLKKKEAIARRYRAAFRGVEGLGCMPLAPWARPTHWLFTVTLEKREAPAERLVARLKEAGIEARRLWRPLHRLPMYKGDTAYRVELADALYERAVSLPSSVGLGPKEQERVIKEVLNFMKGA